MGSPRRPSSLRTTRLRANDTVAQVARRLGVPVAILERVLASAGIAAGRGPGVGLAAPPPRGPATHPLAAAEGIFISADRGAGRSTGTVGNLSITTSPGRVAVEQGGRTLVEWQGSPGADFAVSGGGITILREGDTTVIFRGGVDSYYPDTFASGMGAPPPEGGIVLPEPAPEPEGGAAGGTDGGPSGGGTDGGSSGGGNDGGSSGGTDGGTDGGNDAPPDRPEGGGEAAARVGLDESPDAPGNTGRGSVRVAPRRRPGITDPADAPGLDLAGTPRRPGGSVVDPGPEPRPIRTAKAVPIPPRQPGVTDPGPEGGSGLGGRIDAIRNRTGEAPSTGGNRPTPDDPRRR